jgi:KipI family sensor histidine kinase inhibitor
LGESAVVLEFAPPIQLAIQQRIWQLNARLRDDPDILETIPGMNNLTILLRDPLRTAAGAVDYLLDCWQKSEIFVPKSRKVEIPVIYGCEHGPDLDVVAQHTGMTPRQVVECHSSTSYIVYFLGFQPGFPYMGGLPKALETPRRSEPRIRVPAGSVGIGGAQTGIYPLATPGGWQLLGRTSLALFDPHAKCPTALLPGDEVRFVPQPEGVC